MVLGNSILSRPDWATLGSLAHYRNPLLPPVEQLAHSWVLPNPDGGAVGGRWGEGGGVTDLLGRLLFRGRASLVGGAFLRGVRQMERGGTRRRGARAASCSSSSWSSSWLSTSSSTSS